MPLLDHSAVRCKNTGMFPSSAQGVVVTGETGDPMRCPSCNHDNPGDASFCEGCGAKLELICPACKASVSPGARFCKKCGTAIGPTKSAASTTVSSTKSQIIVATDGAASEAIDGARKTVTALYEPLGTPIVRCDVASRFLGISLANCNVVVSLALAAVAVWGIKAARAKG